MNAGTKAPNGAVRLTGITGAGLRLTRAAIFLLDGFGHLPERLIPLPREKREDFVEWIQEPPHLIAVGGVLMGIVAAYLTPSGGAAQLASFMYGTIAGGLLAVPAAFVLRVPFGLADITARGLGRLVARAQSADSPVRQAFWSMASVAAVGGIGLAVHWLWTLAARHLHLPFF